PSPAPRERGPSPTGWEGEGVLCLTPRPPPPDYDPGVGTLSAVRERGSESARQGFRRNRPRRGISIAGHRFMTTLRPAASARAAAASSRTPSCIQTTLAPA